MGVGWGLFQNEFLLAAKQASYWPAKAAGWCWWTRLGRAAGADAKHHLRRGGFPVKQEGRTGCSY